MNPKRISFYTLGCRLNQAETGSLRSHLSQNGFEVVPFGSPADMVVVNTCTVTAGGDTDTRRLVRKIHHQFPEAGIALIGCQAETDSRKLAALPGVRWVVGNEVKMDLGRLLETPSETSQPVIQTPTISRRAFKMPASGHFTETTRANLKIQDGCDNFCTFCVIPFTRGRARSRVFQDLLGEAEELTRKGFQELVLTGINVGTYQFEHYRLTHVLQSLLELPGLARLRISSIEPTTIPESIFDTWQRTSKLCRHLHIPLQSASKRVLENMQRNYTLQTYDRFLQRLRQADSHLCLGSDVIVGFPGESESDFQETLEYLEQSPLNTLHVFSYSERMRTKSRHLDNPVPAAVIARRSAILRDLGRRKYQDFLRSFEGQRGQVLFEQQKDGVWGGLTDNYLRVRVPSAQNLKNRLLPVRFHQAKEGHLEGVLVKHLEF